MTTEALLVTRLGRTAGSPSAQPDGPSVTVVCEAGPSAGRTHQLGVGRHVVGRGCTAAITVADPSVEPHHVLLDVNTVGAVDLI